MSLTTFVFFAAATTVVVVIVPTVTVAVAVVVVCHGVLKAVNTLSPRKKAFLLAQGVYVSLIT